MHTLREPSRHLPQCLAQRGVGVRGNQIGDRFRLSQIHAPVQECAQRHLAGFGCARAQAQRRRDNALHHEWRAVGVEFDDILARVTMWRLHIGQQPLIQHRIVGIIHKVPKVQIAGCERARLAVTTKERLRDGE